MIDTSSQTIDSRPARRFVESMTRLGERLRELRAKKGITQEEAAGVAHVKPITYSRWERGAVEKPEDPEGLARLARYYGTTIDELVTADRVAERSSEYISPPESFRLWREAMAPADVLTPEIERRMLETGMRYSKRNAWRWSNILAEVLVEMEDRRPPAKRKQKRKR